MVSKTVSTQQSKNGLLPTPPLPQGLPIANLTENARQVLMKRYVRRGDDGQPAETVEEMFWRVAWHVARVEEAWNEDVEKRAVEFYRLLSSKKFFPNSPTFTGAGTPLGQLAACFVLKINDDMGRDSAGIFQTLRDAALIQQTGGGNGFSFSRLRPAGSMVKSSAGQATGPVGFLRVYDHAFGEVAQGGVRRGANMSVLRVDHPDVEEFIACKTNENHITNFNISVGVTNAFMRAVKEDKEWELRFPDIDAPEYRSTSGTLEQMEAANVPLKVYKRLRARDLFNKIVKQAHHNGEPGVLFLDAANRENPVPHLYQLEATNPCFAGSTRIATDLGLLTIRELAETSAPFMVATDMRAPHGGRGFSSGEVGIAYRISSPAWKTRENVPTLKMTTRHGFTVTATADHKFLTAGRGYVELGDLKRGDVVLLQSGAGVWNRNTALPHIEDVQEPLAVPARGGEHAPGHAITRRAFAEAHPDLPKSWSHALGVVLGALVGDGWLSPDNDSAVGIVFKDDADELLYTVQQTVQAHFQARLLHEHGSVRRLTSGKGAYLFFTSLGVLPAHAHEKRVPASVWTAPREAVVGFLQGLFTTNGTVNLASRTKSCSIRLAGSSVEMLRDVQMLLLNFGIVSRIHKRRVNRYHRLPAGDGGSRESIIRANYELDIDQTNRDTFASEIGFLDSAKQNKAQQSISGKAPVSNSKTFETTIVSIVDGGSEDVYDLTEPQTHSLIANGIVAHQCGEQWLGPYENCCLGSVNLNEHCGPAGTVDWESLRQSVVLSTRFLDDVVEANAYVPAVPQLKEAAHRARRIGLGIMGLADLMYHVGVRYGSPEGQEFGALIMEFVRYHAMKTSIELAEARGPFPAIQNSIYDMDNMVWMPPRPLTEIRDRRGRPEVRWELIVEGIKQHGIRNAAQTTVAPTGTIATVAGCEGYGCEPVFALAYYRHVNDNGKDLKLTYASPRFEDALRQLGLGEEKRRAIVEQVMKEGTCQHIAELPQSIRDTFVVSADISAEEHVRMQAALQAFVDNSLSKCVTADTLILTANGLAPISSLSEMRLPDQFEAHDLTIVSPAGKEWSDLFYYGGMRETRHIRLAHGYEIEGTPNHQVHVLQADGRVDFKRLDELKIGDEMVLYMGQQVFGQEARPLPHAAGNFNPTAAELFIPQQMSAEFAYLLGCLISSGSLGEDGFEIGNADRILLENLGRLIEKLFGLTSHMVQDTRRAGVHVLQVHSRPLQHWLVNDLGLENRAHNRVIPACILRASRAEIAAFLRGLFLDACLTLDGRRFEIGLASRRLLRQLQTLFLNFGVFSMISQTGEHAWALKVSGEAFDRLAAFVEFTGAGWNERIESRTAWPGHLFHNHALRPLESAPANWRHMRITIPEPQRNSSGARPRADGAQPYEYERARVNLPQGHRLDRALAGAIDDQFEICATALAGEFSADDGPGVLYVKVQGIEAGFAEVFDISVPGSHAFIANGICNHNTINFPETATEDDVARAYMLAWELGCKGITVYVTGSREKVVLETKATAEKRAVSPMSAEGGSPKPALPATWHDPKKPRPRALTGKTYTIETPVGKAFITINENGGSQPFEAFVNTAKAGSETAAVSEAIGRLISYILRITSPIKPTDRMREIVRQLIGIGGGRSLGFGPNRVRSLPDGIGQVLDQYLREKEGLTEVPDEKTKGNGGHKIEMEAETVFAPMKIGDLCPECGEAAVVNEEGCRKCYACGYSEC